MSEVRRLSIIEEGRGQYMYYSSPDVPQIQTIMPAAPAPAADAPSARIAFDPIPETAASVRAGGKLNLKAESSPTASGGIDEEGNSDDNDGGEKTPTPSIRCRHNSVAESTMSCGPDAVERLSDWFGDLITPAIYALLVIIGLPLYFVLNFSLPLILGLNLLIFIGAITVVPPKIRRFAHLILATSILTVLVIWALAAMKGNGLKETLLGSYQVGEKYYDI
ncbi:unnamed protein product [Tilletia laevis]|nr:unnamed protein product [Tilletia laevis]